MKVNERQNRAIDYWFANGCKNKRDAMKKAGYSDKTAEHMVSIVFDRPEVLEEIERRHTVLRAKNQLTLQWVIDAFKGLPPPPRDWPSIS